MFWTKMQTDFSFYKRWSDRMFIKNNQLRPDDVTLSFLSFTGNIWSLRRAEICKRKGGVKFYFFMTQVTIWMTSSRSDYVVVFPSTFFCTFWSIKTKKWKKAFMFSWGGFCLFQEIVDALWKHVYVPMQRSLPSTGGSAPYQRHQTQKTLSVWTSSWKGSTLYCRLVSNLYFLLFAAMTTLHCFWQHFNNFLKTTNMADPNFTIPSSRAACSASCCSFPRSEALRWDPAAAADVSPPELLSTDTGKETKWFCNRPLSSDCQRK